jgi:hypothetical protein
VVSASSERPWTCRRRRSPRRRPRHSGDELPAASITERQHAIARAVRGVAGELSELGYGTTGLTVGQRVFGLADWTRDGSLAEYTAVEARNLAQLPADIDYTVAAAVPISGLTAWQGLFDHDQRSARPS